MITQDLINAGMYHATCTETQEMNELLAEGDLYGWANKLESIAKRQVSKAFDSKFLGTTPSDLKAIARRSTMQVVK